MDATITMSLFTTDDCDWSELHEDMIHLIFKKFTTVADCLRFGCVCVSWRSIPFAYLHPDLLHPQLPLLMIPTPPPTPPPHQQLTNTTTTTTPKPKLQPAEDEEEETRSFYIISDKSVYKDLHIRLPYNRYCRGSSHGWIITSGMEDTGYSVELFNPFISINNEYQKIQLPPLTAFPEDPNKADYDHITYLYKAIISVNPSSHPKDYVVMAIYGGMGRLGFWRPGDQVWTDVDFDWGSAALDDVIYHKGLFYAVTIKGLVVVINEDLDGGSAAGVRRLTPQRLTPRGLRRIRGSFKRYLVESAGDLLLVDRGSSLEDVNDTVFRVLKLITDHKGTSKWKVVKTLPGRMLFVGDNASLSLAASDFPGGKSSCIYYTDDEVSNWDVGYSPSGIFNMEEGRTIENLRPMGDYISPVNTIWVEPTLRMHLVSKIPYVDRESNQTGTSKF